MSNLITLRGTRLTVQVKGLAEDIYLWKMSGRRPKLVVKRPGTADTNDNQIVWDPSGTITINDGPLCKLIYDQIDPRCCGGLGQRLKISVKTSISKLVKTDTGKASLLRGGRTLFRSVWTLKGEEAHASKVHHKPKKHVTPPAKHNAMCPCDFEP